MYLHFKCVFLKHTYMRGFACLYVSVCVPVWECACLRERGRESVVWGLWQGPKKKKNPNMYGNTWIVYMTTTFSYVSRTTSMVPTDWCRPTVVKDCLWGGQSLTLTNKRQPRRLVLCAIWRVGKRNLDSSLLVKESIDPDIKQSWADMPRSLVYQWQKRLPDVWCLEDKQHQRMSWQARWLIRDRQACLMTLASERCSWYIYILIQIIINK